jgi:hypothetical protein
MGLRVGVARLCQGSSRGGAIMPVSGEQLDPLLGKRVRVYLKDGADLSGVFRVNLKREQRFLLKERGGIDQVIDYHRTVRVVDLEGRKNWWQRLLKR